MCLLAIVMLSIYSVPWLGLLVIFCKAFISNWNFLETLTLCIAIIGIVIQYQLRKQFSQALYTSPKYWWLHWLGGLLIAVMGIVSIIKTEFGWGWTWKGRQLSYIKHNKNSNV